MSHFNKFGDTKGVIRIHISKKDRKHNDQKKKGRMEKQRRNIHIKLKIGVTQTPLKSGMNSDAPEG